MKHHYVPQFLLREWSKGSFDEKVEDIRLDLEGTPSSRRAPKYTANEDDLYALSMPEVAGMDKQAIEKKYLMHIDNQAARVHQKLIKQGLKSLSAGERSDWTLFLMSLQIRQPNIVQKLKLESAEHLTNNLNQQPEEYDAITSDDKPPSLLEFTEQQYPGLIENFGLSFFHELVDNPDIGNRILNMKWWMWDFSSISYDLLIADHPCIFTTGIKDPNLIIALPISPKRAFMATQSESVATLMRGQFPKHLAKSLNISSLIQARVRIFARNTSPKRFIQNWARKSN